MLEYSKSRAVLPFYRRCVWSKSWGLKLGPWIRWQSAGWACIPWVCCPRPWISSRQWSWNKTVYSWYVLKWTKTQTDRLAYLGNNQESLVCFSFQWWLGATFLRFLKPHPTITTRTITGQDRTKQVKRCLEILIVFLFVLDWQVNYN